MEHRLGVAGRERRAGTDPHPGRRRRGRLLRQPGHLGDALRRRAGRRPRDARRADPVRGRGHRRRRRVRADGRPPGRHAAAPRARAWATGWRTCTTRAAAARRWSTSSATTPARTSGWTRRWSPTSTRSPARSPAGSGGRCPRPTSRPTPPRPSRRRGRAGRDRHAGPARPTCPGRTAPTPAAPRAGAARAAGGAVGDRGGRRRARRPASRRCCSSAATSSWARRGCSPPRGSPPAPGRGCWPRRSRRGRAGRRAARRHPAALPAGDGDRRAGRDEAPGPRRGAGAGALLRLPRHARATRCPRTARCTCSASRGRTASPRCGRWPSSPPPTPSRSCWRPPGRSCRPAS